MYKRQTNEILTNSLEEWESIYVELEDITITRIMIPDESYDWSFTDISGEEFLLDDDCVAEGSEAEAWFDALQVGSTTNYLRGIVTYSYGTWKVEVVNDEDINNETGVDEIVVARPVEFILEQNFPNPFNPATHIRYGLPETGRVQVVVYDILGRPVATVVDGLEQAGYHTAYWNGTTNEGMPVASGTYFLRLFSLGKQQVIRMTFTK